MKYLVTGTVEFPGDERGLVMEILLNDVQPEESPEESFQRGVREMGLKPGTVLEVLEAN